MPSSALNQASPGKNSLSCIDSSLSEDHKYLASEMLGLNKILMPQALFMIDGIPPAPTDASATEIIKKHPAEAPMVAICCNNDVT